MTLNHFLLHGTLTTSAAVDSLDAKTQPHHIPTRALVTLTVPPEIFFRFKIMDFLKLIFFMKENLPTNTKVVGDHTEYSERASKGAFAFSIPPHSSTASSTVRHRSARHPLVQSHGLPRLLSGAH